MNKACAAGTGFFLEEQAEKLNISIIIIIIKDFSMNSVCAAGTGSFLDQQVKVSR